MSFIKSVDVSSYQEQTLVNLDQWIGQGCQLLWIHSYHREEHIGLDRITKNWIDVAKIRNCWRLPYCWLFRNGDPKIEVRDSIQVFRSVGENPQLLLLDCEYYLEEDPGPTAEQILSAAEESRSLGVEIIMYSNIDWLSSMAGDKEILRGIPLCLANYNSDPSLNLLHPDWTRLIGHQYTSTPVDWSIWDYEALLALSYTIPGPCQKYTDGINAALKYHIKPKAARLILEGLVK